MAIPQRLMPEFLAHMEAHDLEDLPDGAWFAVLTDAAEAFLRKHNLRGDSNDAVFDYLETIAEPQPKDETGEQK